VDKISSKQSEINNLVKNILPTNIANTSRKIDEIENPEYIENILSTRNPVTTSAAYTSEKAKPSNSVVKPSINSDSASTRSKGTFCASKSVSQKM